MLLNLRPDRGVECRLALRASSNVIEGTAMNTVEQSRRQLLVAGAATLAGAAISVPRWARAAEPLATPSQGLGPFYPYGPEVERDADLVHVKGGNGVAKGEITLLTGRVLDARGRPVGGVQVEIWQCDAFGRYHHPRDGRNAPLDPNFQGYGVFTTGADGAYRFRTIKPVPYPGRTPHIHFRIAGRDIPYLATQMYIAGFPQNDDDFLLRSVVDPKARELLLVSFEPIAGASELSARFDIKLANNGTLQRG
jgi:protocatechuate 3,4-dioxygenase beta subunit